MSEYSKLHCSFCGKSATEVGKLIAGTDIHICDNCIDICHSLIHEGEKAGKTIAVTRSQPAPELPSPREIKEFLDEYVIDQHEAKVALAVAVYNHYKRLANPVVDGVEIEKSNILMIGPTGTGKTLLADTIAKLLDVPVVVTDASSLTEAGYVGEDVESIVGRLLHNADGDVRRCERGIIFLDEIDKKRSKETSNGRDVSGEGVQQAILKMLEASEIMVPSDGGKKSPNSTLVKVNTRNILFICSGAFVGLDRVIERSENKKNSGMGFGHTPPTKSEAGALIKKVRPEHLVAFGIIPELVGRLPIITTLHELDAQALRRVLTEPKHALVKQYGALFKLDEVELEFSEDALLAVAKLAIERKTGGRALRSVIESNLMRTQFDLPDLRRSGVTKVIVNDATINEGVEPITVREKQVLQIQDATTP